MKQASELKTTSPTSIWYLVLPPSSERSKGINRASSSLQGLSLYLSSVNILTAATMKTGFAIVSIVAATMGFTSAASVSTPLTHGRIVTCHMCGRTRTAVFMKPVRADIGLRPTPTPNCACRAFRAYVCRTAACSGSTTCRTAAAISALPRSPFPLLQSRARIGQRATNHPQWPPIYTT